MGLKKSKMSTNPIKRLSEGINYYLNNKYKHAGNVNKKVAGKDEQTGSERFYFVEEISVGLPGICGRFQFNSRVKSNEGIMSFFN